MCIFCPFLLYFKLCKAVQRWIQKVFAYHFLKSYNLDYAYNYEEKFYTGWGYFLVVGSNGYVPLDGVGFSGLTIMGLHFYKSY